MITHKIAHKFLLILFSFFIFVALTGCAIQQKSDDIAISPPNEQTNSKAFWNSNFFSDFTLNDRDDIQAFLETQDGILKSYREEYKHNDGYKDQVEAFTGAMIIGNASHQYTYDINSRVLMTILELKWHLITDKNASVAQVKQDLLALLKEVDDEYIDVERYEYRTLLLYFTDFGYVLQGSYEKYPERDVLQFKDGTVMKVDPAINAGTYAVQKTFALFAKDYGEWEEWMGDGSNSFYQTYERLFGDPNGA